MLNLVVDTYGGIFKYDLSEFAEPNKIKRLASVFENSLKDLMESVCNKHRQEYAELKQCIEKYLSNPDNYEKDKEGYLKNNIKNRVFLEVECDMYNRKVSYDYSDIEDLAIALMLMFENIYNQLTKIDEVKAYGFKHWAIEEIGNMLGSSFWYTLEFCILD